MHPEPVDHIEAALLYLERRAQRQRSAVGRDTDHALAWLLGAIARGADPSRAAEAVARCLLLDEALHRATHRDVDPSG